MSGAVLVAIVASIGNLLQGWDNATIAAAVLYIKKEFQLQNEPTVEGLIVSMSLIGATIVTTFSGPLSDSIGRRPMLILSSILYFFSGLIMLWSPNVYVLLLARFVDGFGIGLAVTLVPLYISEIAPSEIRGLLNTLPQFSGSGGMFLSYCMVFGMSLSPSPDWRIMLGVLAIPSLFFFGLTIFYLPESPRWLVSKGRMAEAKKVLQKLRGKDDVSGELSLLLEGLEVGGDTSIEEYIIGPATEAADDLVTDGDKEQITLYGPEEGQSWIARPSKGPSMLGSVLSLASRHGSMVNQSVPLMDPIVTLFGSVHENMPQAGGSMRSTLFPNFGSMFSVTDQHAKNEQWDEENLHRDDEEYASDGAGGDYEDNLHSPLLSRQATGAEGKDIVHHGHRGSALSMRRQSLLGEGGDGVSSTDIGGGWQLAWKWSEKEGENGRKEGGFKRVYLHQEGVPGSRRGSIVSLPGGGDVLEGSEFVHAAALVSQSALFSKGLAEPRMSDAAMVHPSEVAAKGSRWKDLFEPGVRRALLVGVGIQILQQFAGINGVLYYTPQILEQAGVAVILSKFGLSSASASILISSLTTLLMLPCIGFAMLLMDLSGRRFLLLGTIPILIASLVILVVSNLIDLGTLAHALLSTVSVIVYFCCFVMGFGPIPNILCAEIFPTRVRGLCIAICAFTFWIGDIIVTYSLPVMLNAIGLAGVFSIYAVVCLISFVFVFLKVPETKGMPLEVITEFFAVGAKQAAAKA
ncbi:monosaccharide-sensing protein 2 [Zea mays]|uniref:Monosaccharide-sensing protein 2 n=3 Tax=Zea mays TaxID=4577 RepID=A0A096PY37_MAIZE|nr:monosaccharide-sensing protein 2 [Zea mays]XP_008645620.1 monosaccharide-sensing protein 2 [Zea mays]XP_020394092.1 monosaccharide-sensing protein 2 [Zea mays]XP_035815034.1 monosaccharide-sensing protein 2 [Zea mays]AQK70393.1 Monosaccharide-sensing protein 2 [Zea mays]AQK70396.1 Monosaccharide-sensing protein 2 [Zea mays]AQK70398.1 Monosaccharide-sensing protein 2 [Zea mays]AQK70399.1 Monosaccharide-sensing protein 2 [Zea mays]|eukprot:XP_008645619.1 monosaccharide-sensing protein 2 [Zea mays]